MKSLHARGIGRLSPKDRHADARGECSLCDLPVGEQFVLWALRQWQCELTAWERDGAFPVEESGLRSGFVVAGLLEALPGFAMAMDAILFGIGRTMEIRCPPCPAISCDEPKNVSCELC